MATANSSNSTSTPKRTRKRKSRGQGLRTRTGCATCRKRHLKCDEDKPICGACSKSGHSCVYFEQPSKILTSPPGPPSLDPNTSQELSQSAVTSEALQRRSEEGADNRSTWISSPIERRAGGSTMALTPQDAITNSPDNAYVHTIVSGNLSYHSGPSPNSTDEYLVRSVSNNGAMIDVAISKWFGLLAGDAALEGVGFSQNSDGLPYSTNNVGAVISPNRPEDSPMGGRHHFQDNSSDEAMWQSPVVLRLRDHEKFIFQNFVQRVSHWIDLFDPMKHFSTYVPHLAMRNVGLLQAILALSARHLSLVSSTPEDKSPDRNDALQYYNETLQYVQKAMQFDNYNTSLELLATCLIVSAYEMLDGSRRDWERHLKGVFWIQRSQVIHGDSQGLKQAVWWTWLCQDIWAAFRERRKAFTFWKPARKFNELTSHELAARSVYVMAQVVNFCSEEEIKSGQRDLQSRIEDAESLDKILDEWQDTLTVEFTPLPLSYNSSSTCAFEPLWIHPPSFGVSVQVHYAARILLLLHRPSLGGLSDYIEQQATLARFVNIICGIAATLTDDASGVMCSQCLFIAGTCTPNAERRHGILQLINSCRQRTGWPIKPLAEELEAIWEKSDNG